jgi:hypothetical protein
MFASNGDHPTTSRVVNQPRAISIAQPFPQAHQPFANDLFPDINFDPELSLIYALLGGMGLLLVITLMWSLLP